VTDPDATKCYVGSVKTISQRELRNDNADIVRGVEAGESYLVTRRGVPVARLVPLTDEPDLRLDRPAKSQPRYASRPRVTSSTRTADLLEELRSER
jgi:prevent-host-death family protein